MICNHNNQYLNKNTLLKSEKDDTMDLENSAGIVLYNSGRYLLLNYGRSWTSANRWGLTKGRIEKNESIIQAALREAEEETGISDINIEDDFEHKVTYYFSRGHTRVKKTVVYIIGITPTKEVRLSKEHIGYCWAKFEESLEMLAFENTRRIIRAAEKFLKDRALTRKPEDDN